MFGLVHLFGATSSGPTVFITPLNLFNIGHFAITNSMLYGWISAVLLIIFFTIIAHRITIKPKGGLIQIVEVGADFITNMIESSFVDKERGRKYVPYFVTLFFFILFNNWLGLIPGVGDSVTYHGNPLLRAFTGDWNATAAAAVITMGLVYGASIKAAGFKKYMGHFFVGNPLNPLYLFIGVIEMFTDLTRVISLSIRLFLNVTIGEIVIAVFSYLGHTIASPITAAPFVMIEIFIAALQAYIFVILSVNYLAIAVNHVTAHEDLTDEDVPETMALQPEEA